MVNRVSFDNFDDFQVRGCRVLLLREVSGRFDRHVEGKSTVFKTKDQGGSVCLVTLSTGGFQVN